VISAIFTGLEKVRPPSLERTTDTPKFRCEDDVSKSRHETYTSPSASTAMSHPWPEVFPAIEIPLEKVSPPSVERAK
jgi:hypothetical protein